MRRPVDTTVEARERQLAAYRAMPPGATRDADIVINPSRETLDRLTAGLLDR